MSLTYDRVGISVDRRDREHRATIGEGRTKFETASAEVMRWQIKTRSGFRVDRPDIALGADYVIRLGPLVENVRVVRIVDEPRRKGFAYGTLAQHPLKGEEAFLVEWRDDDRVDVVIRSFSTPNGAFWTLMLPVMAIARRVFIRRYLRALLD